MFRRRRIRERLRQERNAASLPFINVLLALFGVVALFTLAMRAPRAIGLDFVGCGCGPGHEPDHAVILVSSDRSFYWDNVDRFHATISPGSYRIG